MTGIEHATLGVLILMGLVLGPIFYYLAQDVSNRYLRRLPGVDAIDEATGRSAEMGRPLSFSTGMTGISPLLYACLGILHYIARKAARYRSKILLPQIDPSVLAITEEVARDAYRAEGKLHAFDQKSLMFLSDDQFAYAAGYMGLVQRERVASAFLFGSFAAESLILAEAGQQAGAMQVAGTTSPEQVPFFICTCDYTLIGEEVYGSAAYLTRDRVQVGSVYAQDRAKLIFFVLMALGILFATWNSVVTYTGHPGLAAPDMVKEVTREVWTP